MSQIAITGASTGTATFTIESPATNTNRTLTLPDNTGTIITTAGGEPISGTTGSFSGDLSFNSGYGSAAVAYGCRAWVNFNGTANSNLSGTYTRTSPSTTVTVTATNHGLIAGNSVNLDFTTGTGVDGIYTVVTVADANTFTVTTVASTTTSGNVTLLRNTIRASGNVSSITDNGTGDYTVNFTTALPDANFCFSGLGGVAGVSLGEIVPNTISSASSARFQNSSGTANVDSSQIFIAVFR